MSIFASVGALADVHSRKSEPSNMAQISVTFDVRMDDGLLEMITVESSVVLFHFDVDGSVRRLPTRRWRIGLSPSQRLILVRGLGTHGCLLLTSRTT